MSKTKRTEKGLLTPDNCVVALIDLQPQMLFGVSSYDRQSIINCNVALAKAAKSFRSPGRPHHCRDEGFSGIIWPQIRAVFPGQPLLNAHHEFLGRREFRRSYREDRQEENRSDGVWTETCVALATIQALHDGYEVYVVEDCCGDVSQLAHDNAMKRVSKPARSRSPRSP